MGKECFLKGEMGIGEAGSEVQCWGREAALVGTGESTSSSKEALTHWKEHHSAAPFLLRLRNSELIISFTVQAPHLESEI